MCLREGAHDCAQTETIMAELMLEPRIAAIAARNRITADDVLFLRRNVYQDGMS